jgi:hypothetical protein
MADGILERLEAKLDLVLADNARLHAELHELETKINPVVSKPFLTTSDIAQIRGLTVEALHAQPWLQPFFGQADGRVGREKAWKTPRVIESGYFERLDGELRAAWEKAFPRAAEKLRKREDERKAS